MYMHCGISLMKSPTLAHTIMLSSRHRVNSRIGIAYLKKKELKFATKHFYPEINLPFNFLIQKYFFHDNPT